MKKKQELIKKEREQVLQETSEHGLRLMVEFTEDDLGRFQVNLFSHLISTEDGSEFIGPINIKEIPGLDSNWSGLGLLFEDLNEKTGKNELYISIYPVYHSMYDKDKCYLFARWDVPFVEFLKVTKEFTLPAIQKGFDSKESLQKVIKLI